jgi:signal recognition particle subunit SRP54
VAGSLNPGQALVGIVHKELAATMGEGVADINLATQPPAVILMAGLQGAGKTTTTAKLARHLIDKRKKKVLTVSADVYRPAAIEQLKTVTGQAGAEWFAVAARPEAARHRAGRARPREAPLLRRAAGRHRRPAGASTRR